MKEEMTTGDVSIPTTMKPSGKIFNKAYFDCDDATMSGCFKARQKGKHMKTYMNKNAQLSNGIKDYFNDNPKENSVMLRSPSNAFLTIGRKGMQPKGFF